MNNYQRLAGRFALLSIISFISVFLLLNYVDDVYILFLLFGILFLILAIVFNSRAEKEKRESEQK